MSGLMKLLLVLIPILMDYPLGVIFKRLLQQISPGLNPYSNGLPSRGPVFSVESALQSVS